MWADLLGSLRAMLRPTDIVGRFGGDRLAVILAETGAAGATFVAERMRVGLQARSAGSPTNEKPCVGVGTIEAANSFFAPTGLLSLADTALQRAIAGGGARVELEAPTL
jgi:diguanylate cyclase (GGDEF)-like protein